MKLLISAFFVLVARNFLLTQCEELVGALVPKTIYETKPFYTLIQVYNLKDPAELAIQFHGKSLTYELIKDGHKAFKFIVNKFGMRKSVNLTMTLYREKKMCEKVTKMCNTQVREIKVVEPKFHIFIQMDKPIYMPGDVVKFRIIIVDEDLKPHQMNALLITITDPYGRSMKQFDEPQGENIGIFLETFSLDHSSLLGEWKIAVVVDGKENKMVSNIFPVQEYSLPLLQVQIKTDSKYYLLNHKLTISFSAKYSFGNYASGDAELVVRDTSSGKTCFTKKFKGVTGMETTILNIKRDLRITGEKKVNLTAALTFTEPETKTTFNHSTTFIVDNSEELILDADHPETYMPGLPFNMKVTVWKWNGDKFITNEPVDTKFSFVFKNGSKHVESLYQSLKDGSANDEIIVPLGVVKLEIESKLASSMPHRANIMMGKLQHAGKSLTLGYKPKRPQFGSDVEIYVNSVYRMKKILVATATKHGIIKSQAIQCKDEAVCNFKLAITSEMLPRFTVEVYHVKDKDVVEHGSMDIETENLGENYLKMNMSSNLAKVKTKVSMTFDTDNDSTIYLLAIDKRLKMLRDGNDVRREDVAGEFSVNDRQSEVLLDDMTTWHECTTEEVKRVESGKVCSMAQSSDTFEANIDDVFNEWEIQTQIKTERLDQPQPTEDGLLRHDFTETWIFDTIQPKSSKTKSYMVPDAITSWHISAFSLNENSGLAIMNPQELAVKSDFFVEFSLPYSIRYKEVLRVDVLVFNYIQSKINVKVTVKNLKSKEFQFVEYPKNGKGCNMTSNSKPYSTKNVKFSKLGMKMVPFYIRSSSADENDENDKVKLKKIQVIADAADSSGKKYKDSVQKILRIEPVGVRILSAKAHTFMVRGEKKTENNIRGPTDRVTKTYCAVSGDYLTNLINLNSRFEIYPGSCLEQRTSKLKGNVQVYKYFSTKNKIVEKCYFEKQYQAIWEARAKCYNYESSSGYIAYFIDAVVSAMELNLINRDTDVIEKELDKLKSAQSASGSFNNFGNFPVIDARRSNDTKTYFQTAFVLISFLKARNFSKTNYTNVIEKAFEYLGNKLSVENEGLSIAAYAYALDGEYAHGRNHSAMQLLDKIGKLSAGFGNSKRCIKHKLSDKKCHTRHTVYIAMAYLKLGQIENAMPLIHWLIGEHNYNALQGYTYETAILSEPIADAVLALGVNTTNFEVFLNKPFWKRRYTNKNINDYYEVPFPPNTSSISMIVDGTGFCSITRVDEILVIEKERVDVFSVEITPEPSENSPRRVVRICATFNSTNTIENSLLNVIYEVEFPSGYIYDGILDEQKHMKDIKDIEERKDKTLVLIYYNDFEGGIPYCVDVKAWRKYEVKDSRSAGVKVYSFSNKKYVAVEFYEFNSTATC